MRMRMWCHAMHRARAAFVPSFRAPGLLGSSLLHTWLILTKSNARAHFIQFCRAARSILERAPSAQGPRPYVDLPLVPDVQ